MPEEQYQASLWLHKELIKRHGIEPNGDHIIGHYRIDPVNKSRCPGPSFPWDRLLEDVNTNDTPSIDKGSLYAAIDILKNFLDSLPG
jgi:N-acetyl-anhydromuramyl-L-alanine amidase AmpD